MKHILPVGVYLEPIISMYYIYILQSLKDPSYYIGYSSNVESRLKQHNQGKSKFTKGHRPYRVIHTESFQTKKEAKSKEQFIKRFKNIKKYLEMIGSPDFVGTSPATAGES